MNRFITVFAIFIAVPSTSIMLILITKAAMYLFNPSRYEKANISNWIYLPFAIAGLCWAWLLH